MSVSTRDPSYSGGFYNWSYVANIFNSQPGSIAIFAGDCHCVPHPREADIRRITNNHIKGTLYDLRKNKTPPRRGKKSKLER